MQDITENPVIHEPTHIAWFLSLSILILVIAGIGGLYGYGYMSASDTDRLQTEIAQLDQDIKSGSADKDVIIANILSSTSIRPAIDLKNLVKMFKSAAIAGGVRLKGFTIKDDTITTSLIATSSTDGIDPVETVIAMMRNANTNTGLVLEPIYSLAGSPTERTTSVSFRVLSPKPTPNAVK